MPMKKAEEVEKKVSSKRDSGSLDDFFEGLPIPRAKPKAAQKEDIKAPDEKFKPVGTVIKECRYALEEYNLINLVEQAKRTSFKEMRKPDKELLCAGLIKLGEALTYCKNAGNDILFKIGIVDIAIKCAKARNHFVHHQLYHTHLNKHIEVQRCIDDVSLISTLEEKLKKLQESGLEKLSKPINKPENDFPFVYDHFVKCLKAEFTELKAILAAPDTLNKINSDKVSRITLENRIRNILAIMVDLTDEGMVNKNKGNFCVEQKKNAIGINKEFVEKFDTFLVLFGKIKEFRNSLCHLDDSLPKPYTNYEKMFEFAKKLLSIEELGYLNIMEKQFLQDQKKEPVKQEEKTEKEKPIEQKKEVKAQQKITEGLQKVLEYGSDEEKKQEPQAPTNTTTPRMGGH